MAVSLGSEYPPRSRTPCRRRRVYAHVTASSFSSSTLVSGSRGNRHPRVPRAMPWSRFKSAGGCTMVYHAGAVFVERIRQSTSTSCRPGHSLLRQPERVLRDHLRRPRRRRASARRRVRRRRPSPRRCRDPRVRTGPPVHPRPHGLPLRRSGRGARPGDRDCATPTPSASGCSRSHATPGRRSC